MLYRVYSVTDEKEVSNPYTLTKNERFEIYVKIGTVLRINGTEYTMPETLNFANEDINIEFVSSPSGFTPIESFIINYTT